MINIIEATEEHLPIIQSIAIPTWYNTYSQILSADQSEYMLEMMYSLKALKEQINQKSHCFLFAQKDDEYLGYVSYELNSGNSPKTKIHKLYVLPEYHGHGVGKILIDKVIQIARSNSNEAILLNMNKQNKAIHFYNKIGFQLIGEECNQIGNGYVMDDYIFEKKL